MQGETSSSTATEDKREHSLYGCGSESTFGPLSEAGGEKTASSFTSGPGCREAGQSAHSTPARGKAVVVAQNQSSNSPAANGLKKSTSFSDRFSTFFKELIAPKKPTQGRASTGNEVSPNGFTTPVRGASAGGSTAPQETAKKAAPSHTDPGAIDPNRQSLLFRVSTLEHTRQHKLLHAVADLLEGEREASRIRNLVRSWLTTASATKPPLACASPRTPLGPPQTQRTPTGSLIQSSPPNISGSTAAKPESSPSPLKVVPFPGSTAHDSDVFSESREATIDSESSPAVRDLLDSLPSMTLTEEEITRRAIRTRLFDFYERYDPLHVPPEAAVDAVIAARIPEHVLFHFLQSKYGLLPPASPSPKRVSAADAMSELHRAPSSHHIADPAILDPALWQPSWSALLAPFVPHPDFQPLVWTAASGKISTIDRFKRLPPYLMQSGGDKCQVFMFEGYPVVLNHTKRVAVFPALPSAENMFDLPNDCLADLLEAHTPPVPDANSCLSYAVPKQWVRRKDTRDPLAFRVTAARTEKPLQAPNDRDEAASAASDLGVAPLGEFNAWF